MSNTLKGQVLILPINKCVFSAGYKNAAYLKQQGYNHYGVDLFSSSNLTVYACGDGEVVDCGWDGITGNDKLGNVIVIVYKNVQMINNIYNAKGTLIAKKGDVIDLTCRMFHFSQILCEKGQKVTKDTVIGYYGNTGSTLVNGKAMGYHLHIEFDTDTNYPTLAYGYSKGGGVINRTEDVKAAGGLADSTVDPSLLWTLDSNQSIYGKYVGWYEDKDVNLPNYSDFSSEATETVTTVTTSTSENYFDGIDVSVHNGTINWAKVKASGIDFAIIRVGWSWYEGGLDVDKNFKTNITGAIDAGLDVGVYVYAYDKTPEAAAISAEKVIEAIKPYKITYPIVYDMEETKLCGYTTNTKAYNNSIASAFLNKIEENKYYGMLYTYTSFALSYLDMSSMTNYDFWIADYRSKEKLDTQFKYSYGMWQYIGTGGTCDGVTGDCDKDYSYKNYAKIIKNAGLNHLDDVVVEETTAESESTVEKTDSEKITELEQQIAQLKVQIENIEDEKAKLEKALAEEQSTTKSLEEKLTNIKTKLSETIDII